MEKTIGAGGLSTTAEELMGDEFNLTPPKEAYREDILRTVSIRVRPITTGYEHNSPYTFEIPADPQKWTDLRSLRLHGQVTIWKNNNGNLEIPEQDENFSVACNFFQSLWAKIIVRINGLEISDPSSNPYPYKVMIETDLSYDNDFKKTVLENTYYIPDTAGNTVHEIKQNTNGSVNQGYINRRKGLSKGQTVEMNILLHSDIITAKRHLPPNHKIDVVLTRMPDNFSLIVGQDNTNTYKIDVQNLFISMDRMEVSEPIQKSLLSGGLKSIPFSRNMVKVIYKSAGDTDLGSFTIFNGQLPEVVYVFFVLQEAYDGDAKKNPYILETIPLIEANLVVNGYSEPPTPYTNTNTSGARLDCYYDFLKNTGFNQLDSQAVSISADDYYKGKFILAWDRTARRDNRFMRPRPTSGSMGLNLKANGELKKNTCVIIYATYSSSININGDDITTRQYF